MCSQLKRSDSVFSAFRVSSRILRQGKDVITLDRRIWRRTILLSFRTGTLGHWIGAECDIFPAIYLIHGWNSFGSGGQMFFPQYFAVVFVVDADGEIRLRRSEYQPIGSETLALKPMKHCRIGLGR